MSNVLVKNLVLSQPKAGLGENGPVTPTLSHTSSSVGEATTVEVEIPGVDPSTVEVNFIGSTLHVSCERGELTLPLNANTDTSKITAEILWGLLTLTVPTPAPPAAGSIKVSVKDSVKKAPTKTAEGE